MSEMNMDPLYIIFEQHLYDFNDDTDTEEAFIEKVVNDYIKFLNSNGAIVPRQLHRQVADELKDQVRTMLRKKIYGCMNIREFVEKNKTEHSSDKHKKAL